MKGRGLFDEGCPFCGHVTPRFAGCPCSCHDEHEPPPPPDITRNYHGGNTESEGANRRVDPSKAAMRQRVLQYAVERGYLGITGDETEVALGMLHQTAGARITELKATGQLVATERRRLTRSGTPARVVVARRFAS